MKNTQSAVTPSTHGGHTASAVYRTKPIYHKGMLNGGKNGGNTHEVKTPFTAIHSMA